MNETRDWANSIDVVLSVSQSATTLAGSNVFERAVHRGAGPGLENAVADVRQVRASTSRLGQNSSYSLDPQWLDGARSASLARAGVLAWHAFVQPPVSTVLQNLLEQAATTNRTVRIGIDPGEFAWVPWEGLCDPESMEPLALRTGIAIYRVSHSHRTEVTPGPLRILVAIAAPNGHDGGILDYENELRNVEAAVSGARDADTDIHIVQFATADALRQALSEATVHVLHISGHGSPGSIVLEDDHGGPRVISAAELVNEAFAGVSAPPVVCLAACHTGASESPGGLSFADELIDNGVPAVVATETSVTDTYATAFFSTLYRELARSEVPDLVSAVADARRSTQNRIRTNSRMGDSRLADLDEWSVVTVRTPSPRFELYGRTHTDSQARTGASRGRVVGNFVGRRAEQRMVVEALAAAGAGSIVIQGIGGSGKTALLQGVLAHQLAGRPNAVIRAPSTMNDILGPIGRALISTADLFQGLEAEAQRLLAHEILDDRRPQADRLRALDRAAAGGLPLIVAWDDFDRTQVDADMAQFLADSIPNHARWRFIFTTRRGFTLANDAHKKLRWIHLGSLSRGESLKLMWSLPHLGQLSDVALQHVWDDVGGHPLCLQTVDSALALQDESRQVDGQSGVSDSECDINAALSAASSGVAAQVGIPELIGGLGEFERDLLLRMSVYREPVDPTGLLYQTGDPDPDASSTLAHESLSHLAETLRTHGVDPSEPEPDLSVLNADAVAELAPHLVAFVRSIVPPVIPDERAADAIETLVRLSLLSISPHDMKVSVERLVAAFLRRSDAIAPAAIRDAHKRAAGYWDWRGGILILGIDSWLHSLQQARHHLVLAGDLDEVANVTDSICDRLHDVGDWDAESRLVDQMLQMFDSQPLRQGIWLHRRGNLYFQRGQVDAAETDYRRAAQIHIANGADASLASEYGQLAIIARERGDYDEATRLFNDSLAIDERRGSNSGIARTLGHLGTLASLRGDDDEAQRLLQRSLDLREDDEDHVGIAASCFKLGVFAQQRGDVETARTMFERCFDIRSRLGLVADMSDLLLQMGILECSQGQNTKAKRLFAEARKLAERTGDHSAHAAAILQQAVLALALGDLDEAQRLCDDSIALGIGNRRVGSTGRARLLSAHIASRRGDFELAFETLMDIVNDGEESTLPVEPGTVQHELGQVERARSNDEAAMRWYLKGIGLRLDAGRRVEPEVLESLDELVMDFGQHRFEELTETVLSAEQREKLEDLLSCAEEDRLQRSRSLSERLAAQTGSRLRHRLRSVLDAVEVDQKAGRLAEGIASQREAVSIARSIQMQERGVSALLVAETLRNLATLVWNRDRTTESIALAAEAAHVFGSVPAALFEEDPFEIVQAQSTAMWTLGIILAEIASEFDKALEVTSEAVVMVRAAQNGERPQMDALALALHNQGVRLTECGMLDEALDANYECLRLTEELARIHQSRYDERLASSLVNLANSLLLKDDPRSALEAATRARAIRASALSDVQSEEHLRDFARALQVLGRAHWAASEYAEARDSLQQAIDIFRMVAETNPAVTLEMNAATHEFTEVSAQREFLPSGGIDRRRFDPSLLTIDAIVGGCPDGLRHLLKVIDAAKAAVKREDYDQALQLCDDVDSELAALERTSDENLPNLELDVRRIDLLHEFAEHLDRIGDPNGSMGFRERSLKLLRLHSEHVDQLKSSHANLAHLLAAAKQGLADFESAIALAEEAVAVRQKLVDRPEPHHRFQHLPALVAHMFLAGELLFRNGNLGAAASVLRNAVEISRECLYDHWNLDDWEPITQMHVRGVQWLSITHVALGDFWPSVTTANDAVRVARELSARDGDRATLLLPQALVLQSHHALNVARHKDARRAAEEAIGYLEAADSVAAENDRDALLGDAYLALAQSRLGDDVDDALNAMFRAAGLYLSLATRTGRFDALVAVVEIRVRISDQLVLNESPPTHVRSNAEALTELLERHGPALHGLVSHRVRDFLAKVATCDDSYWSDDLKRRAEQLLGDILP
ncbi:tetratricopeptide repeat protein [Mycobacterium sp. URHD0025]|uniref:tetratricopeptide repeat protein n=1 Tax=Mycobacterium sp. URHD0025 TaxID=1298864 RepID=UPI0012DEF27A|nr:tetratricopeptide repeat protein [Mycobacterium sp. URHD0025]